MKQPIPIGRLVFGGVYLSIAVAILAAAILATSVKKPNQPKVILGGVSVFVEVADTPLLQERGLSGHKKLSADEGMLFLFEEPQLGRFWMKDMLFPIDIIWFDSDHKIVDVWENATPESYPKIFTPRAPAMFVLEVPAGFFAKHNLKTGNTLEILR